jgi:hypothetical protein
MLLAALLVIDEADRLKVAGLDISALGGRKTCPAMLM